MNDLSFWNLWHRKIKVIYVILLIIFIIAGAIYSYAAFKGTHLAINWEVINHWEKFGVLIDSFQVALFDFEVFADNYVVTESFTAGPISINHSAVKVYLFFLGISLSILLAVVTVLPRFWYIAGMAFFIFFLTSLKLEQLQLFGRTDFTGLIGIFLVYIPISYYLHAIRPDVRFFSRILIFIFLTSLVVVLISSFSEIAFPWLYIANFGLAGPIILSLIFIVLVSHEIIAAILFLITNYNTKYSRNSLLHFSVLCLVYLVNLLLAYLHTRGALSWNIIYINAFILLLVSAVVGIWGFRKRSELFANMVPMNGPAELMYLCLGIICFATIGFQLISANDPILETFEDAIIFSHFGFGLFFFIYILVNFMTLLLQNMRVYRVVYKPVRMPYIISNLGGLAIVMLFLFRANLYPYSQAVAGYFNGIGDVYNAENNLFLAEQYYRLGSGYGYQNHKSNYSLASLATKQNDQATGLFYLKEALSKHPSDFAYVNLANIYNDNARLFDAVFTLKEGLNIFPESGPIKNNLALFYNRLNMIDSSLVFLESALDHSVSKNAAQTNALAIYAKAGKTLRPDSVDAFFQESGYIPVLANSLVIKNQEGMPAKDSFQNNLLNDSVLNLNKFSYLNNYTLNSLFKKDTGLADVITPLLFHPQNASLHENLGFLKALHAYYHQNIAEAFRYMDNLQMMSMDASGYYNYILGVWAMEQDASLLAADFFAKAEEKRIEEATVLKGVALSMSDHPDRAREQWSSLLYDENPELVATASNMLRAINLDRDLTLPEESEIFIHRVLLFNYYSLSEPEILDLLDQIHDPLLKINSIFSLINQFIKNRENKKALFFLEELKKYNNPALDENILWLEAQVWANENNIPSLKNNFKQLQPGNAHQEFLYQYFKGIILE
ncbi:MAG: hypothetical protein M3421_06045, partial [Bacteroidota bacterium]|nr:hypothetical protein [Bacteroidota bacterium]